MSDVLTVFRNTELKQGNRMGTAVLLNKFSMETKQRQPS